MKNITNKKPRKQRKIINQIPKHPLTKPFLKYSFFCLVATTASAIIMRLLFHSEDKIFTKLVGIVVIVALGLLQLFLSWYSISDFPVLHPYIYFYLQTTVFVQLYSYAGGYLRGRLFRHLITYPSAAFQIVVLFMTVLLLPFHFRRNLQQKISKYLTLAMFVIAAFGVKASLFTNKEVVPFNIGLETDQKLQICQLSDIHLGPFMSVERLRKIADDIVKMNPDVVLLTGDFYTVESHHEYTALSEGLEPLKALKGKTFACLGNHDLEQLETTNKELKKVGIKLLIDSSDIIDTKIGKVEVIGFDYTAPWKLKRFMNEIASPLISSDNNDIKLRLIMLHNPSYYKSLPMNKKIPTVTFGGHFHGGQISLGPLKTAIGIIGLPDQGWFCKTERGKVLKANERNKKKCIKDYLYVHRGTGFYGLPLRIGVAGEESIIQLE